MSMALAWLTARTTAKPRMNFCVLALGVVRIVVHMRCVCSLYELYTTNTTLVYAPYRPSEQSATLRTSTRAVGRAWAPWPLVRFCVFVFPHPPTRYWAQARAHNETSTTLGPGDGARSLEWWAERWSLELDYR